MNLYTAVTKNDRNIITVIAENFNDAKEQIKTELTKNPSRRQYYSKWKEEGMKIQVDGIVNV